MDEITPQGNSSQIAGQLNRTEFRRSEANARLQGHEERLTAQTAPLAPQPAQPAFTRFPSRLELGSFNPTGDRVKDEATLRRFLQHVHIVCRWYEVPQEYQWISLALRRMNGEATTWSYHQLLDLELLTEDPASLTEDAKERLSYLLSWSKFTDEALKRWGDCSGQLAMELWGDVEAGARAHPDLAALRQGNMSVPQYAARFRELAWGTHPRGEEPKYFRVLFARGLSAHLRGAFCMSVRVTSKLGLEEVIEWATQLEVVLVSLNLKSYREPCPDHRPSRNNPRRRYRPAPSADEPRDLNTAEIRPHGGHPRLSDEEYARRRASGACMRCGQKGHWRYDCPLKNKGSRVRNGQNQMTPNSARAVPRDGATAPVPVRR